MSPSFVMNLNREKRSLYGKHQLSNHHCTQRHSYLSIRDRLRRQILFLVVGVQREERTSITVLEGNMK